ncbi:hypothetical protein [Saccharopolyspora shandongensis]|uniref:hypothetical protein n=1 Tax=Saccharopolyspora shandongensis TaxID=418495 RepID=UPI0033F69C9B
MLGRWRYQGLGKWGQLRLRPRHPLAALFTAGWGTWEVEWRAGSHHPSVPTPRLAEPAWLAADDHRWHPLVLPRGRRAAVVRAAEAALHVAASFR